MSGPVIDVHAHVVPPACFDLIKAKAENQNFVGDMSDVDQRLRDMDKGGIDIQVMSAWQGYFGQSAAVAAAFNDAVADYAAAHPDRLFAMGVVPFTEPALAVSEVERVMRELGLRGVAIGSNAGGKDLDHPDFADFFAAAEELACPIFIHPTNPLGVERLRAFELVNLLGFVTDTAVAAARLALGGVLERHPNLKVHLAHGGGSTAWFASRWDHGWREREAAGGTAQRPSQYLKNLYVDSILHGEAALEFACRFWTADHLMLGTDYPYDMGMPNAADWIRRHEGLGSSEKASILSGTARRFFAI